MHDNRRFISGSRVYVKTTILGSVVELHSNEYSVNHYFKEIIKNNDLVEQTVDEKINWEDDLLSTDLNDKTTQLGYNCYSQKFTSSNWEEPNEKHLQIKNDLPKIEAMVNNSRYEISKRVFGTKIYKNYFLFIWYV